MAVYISLALESFRKKWNNLKEISCFKDLEVRKTGNLSRNIAAKGVE